MGTASSVGPPSAGRLQPVRDLVESALARSGDVAAQLESVFPDIASATFRPEPAHSLGRLVTQPVTAGTTLFSNWGRYSAVWERTALIAVPSEVPLWVVIDDGAPQAMTKVLGSKYQVHLHAIEPGRTHSFILVFDGCPVAMDDVAGYLGQSYDAEGVARGR